MPTMIDLLLWSPEAKFHPGQRIGMREFEVEVKKVLPDGRPAAVEFTFRKSLDSPDYLFICTDSGLVKCRFPESGQDTRLSGITLEMFTTKK